MVRFSDGLRVFQNGTAALPSVFSGSDVTTGIYFSAAAINITCSGVVRSQFATDGLRTAMIYPLSSPASITMKGLVTDGATAIGIKLGNHASLTTAGAKITSFYSDAFITEKAYVTKDGYFGWIAGNTQATVGAAGGAAGLPATPTGYKKVDIGGTMYVTPYYASA